MANVQEKAIIVFSTTQDPGNKLLDAITQPMPIATGSNDTMLPTDSSYELFKMLKNAQVVVMYPDSNHGAIFQYHDRFVQDVENFLSRRTRLNEW